MNSDLKNSVITTDTLKYTFRERFEQENIRQSIY